MLVVEAVKERQLLLSMTGIVGRVDIEDEPLRPARAVPLDTLLDEQAIDLGDLAGGDPVLESRERRLTGEVVVEVPVGDGFEDGVMAQAGVVVDVLVAGDHGKEALAQEGERIVFDLRGVTGIVQTRGDSGRPAEPVVQLTQRQQPRIGTDQSALEIGDDPGRVTKRKGELLATRCHRMASLPECDDFPIGRILPRPGGHFHDSIAAGHE